ncbi:MAG: hypothetical protein ACREOO_20165 [bacterium]
MMSFIDRVDASRMGSTSAAKLSQTSASTDDERGTTTPRPFMLEVSEDHPRLPRYVRRARDQKICPYCKHAIQEDPYFRRKSYWQRILQNKSYWLRYAVLELTFACAAVLFQFIPVIQSRLLNLKDHVMLPGWMRCTNPDCGELFHATCWYQVKRLRGCLRCHSRKARRVR